MSLRIHPRQGVGSIQFGMTVDQARAAVGKPYKTFMKAPSSEMPADAFESESVNVYYKRPGVCEAIETWNPEAQLEGRALAGERFEQTRAWLETIDPDLKVDETGLTSLKLGIAIYAPSHQHDGCSRIECVLVFQDGYYD